MTADTKWNVLALSVAIAFPVFAEGGKNNFFDGGVQAEQPVAREKREVSEDGPPPQKLTIPNQPEDTGKIT